MDFRLIMYLCLLLSNDAFSKNLRIIGGNEADRKQFPYIASLRYQINKAFFCAGTIISNWHIITAAHCFHGLLQDNIRIYVGTNNLDELGFEYKVRKIHSHPQFYWIEDNGSKVKNDIAVFMVDPRIEFNEFINKIDLPVKAVEPGDIGRVAGWGWTTYPRGTINLKLHMLLTTILSNEECKLIFPLPLADHQVCGLGAQGTGSCFGDSGGPLVIDGKIVGIISLMEPCATSTPDVYTRVHFYLDFIQKSIDSSM